MLYKIHIVINVYRAVFSGYRKALCVDRNIITKSIPIFVIISFVMCYSTV